MTDSPLPRQRKTVFGRHLERRERDGTRTRDLRRDRPRSGRRQEACRRRRPRRHRRRRFRGASGRRFDRRTGRSHRHRRPGGRDRLAKWDVAAAASFRLSRRPGSSSGSGETVELRFVKPRVNPGAECPYRAVAALASFSLLAFTSLGVLRQRLLTQLLGSRRFRCGQRPRWWSAPEAETLEKDKQALHA